jgi:hypothetical protein
MKYKEENLDEEHICESCNKNIGKVTYEPYQFEINDEKIIICLCTECHQNSCDEI